MASVPLLRSTLGAVIAAWTLLALEFAATVVFCNAEFASVWELQWGALWLTPTALVFSAVAAVLLNLGVQGWLSAHVGARFAAYAALGSALALLGVGVTTGRHFEVWWRRAGFVGLLVMGGVTLAVYSRPWLTRAAIERRRVLLAGALALLLGVELANRFLLVRLYPAFHLGMSVLALSLAVLLWHWGMGSRAWLEPNWLKRQRRPYQLALVGGLIVALAGLSIPTAHRLATFDNFRWVLSEQAPVLGNAVQLAAWIAPPPAIAASDELPPTLDPTRPAEGVSFAERDILLVTVDALRADHLGSYGYPRETSPNLDALAREGIRFEYAYCATPHTSYSVTSMMTGKYIRPLLLQGAGAGSDTWANLLRTYGYRTAAFYPPAVFFIDRERFRTFEEANLGFEYQKKEFLPDAERVAQLQEYLAEQAPEQRVFAWVHLFGPHEPYEHHSQYGFGTRDVDRYDSEVRAADATVGEIVRLFRERSPHSVVIVSSDHGEEFGEHGGRYHGSSVYEEQVRVPLLFSVPGLTPKVVPQPVQTIDLLPTTLSALGIPVRPRIRGNDLTPWLQDSTAEASDGFAFAETEEQSMLAVGPWRLLCQRKLGACKLFDLREDPLQRRDVGLEHEERYRQLRQQLQALNAMHGRYEESGLRAEGKHWPGAILRGLAGDGDAAVEVAELLDDANVEIRREAARVLFQLQRPEVATSLRLALQRDEDSTVRRYSALALTRLGEGAALTSELLDAPERQWRRLAALALAQQGDRRGEDVLIGWWLDRESRTHEQALQLLEAFARIRPRKVVWALLRELSDVRLRPQIATTLASIGDAAARGSLAKALREEPYQTNRSILAEALLELGAEHELVVPLRRWMGVPDPLADGLRIAAEADVLQHIGGPSDGDLRRLRRDANVGALVRTVVPKSGNGSGLRVFVRAANTAKSPRSIRIGPPVGSYGYALEGESRSRRVPQIHPHQQVRLEIAPESETHEVWATVPDGLGLEAGRASFLVVYAEQGVKVDALAVLPLQNELGVGSAEPQTDSQSEAGLDQPAGLNSSSAR